MDFSFGRLVCEYSTESGGNSIYVSIHQCMWEEISEVIYFCWMLDFILFTAVEAFYSSSSKKHYGGKIGDILSYMTLNRS